MSRFRAVAAFWLLALPVGLLRAAPLSPPEASAFLEKLAAARRAKPAVEVTFREERRSVLVNKPIVSEGTILYQPPAMMRRETTGSNASIAVCDGEMFWLYYPAFKEVEMYKVSSKPFVRDAIAAATASLNLDKLSEQFRYAVSREGGEYVVDLAPRRASLARVLSRLRIWIRPDFTAARSRISSANGDETDTTFMQEKTVKPDAGQFLFQAPPGTKVVKPLGD